MKALWMLNLRYIKEHKGFFCKAALCIGLLICGVLLSLCLREAFLSAFDEKAASMYGRYDTVVYNADMETVTKNREVLQADGFGIMYLETPVFVKEMNEEDCPYLGYFDENARFLKPPELLKGTLPEKDGEIAMEERVYYQLDLRAEIGDTVSLPLLRNGKIENRDYILKGIMRDYSASWLRSDRQTVGDDAYIPGILTPQPAAEPARVNLLCREGQDITPYQGDDIMAFGSGSSPAQQAAQAQIDALAAVMIFIFLGIMILGICNIVDTDMKNRKRYLITLKCVGLSPRQAVSMYALQAFLLWLCSVALGLLLSALLLYPVSYAVSSLGFFSVALQPALSMASAAAVLIISAAALALPFLLKIRRVAKVRPIAAKTERERKTKAKRRAAKNLFDVWRGAMKKKSRYQNFLFAFLIFVLSFMAAAGSFISAFYPRASFQSRIETYSKEDYTLAVGGGGGAPETFYASFPLKQGATEENIEAVKKSNLFHFNFLGATISDTTYRKVAKGTAESYRDPQRGMELPEEYARQLLSYIGEEDKSELVRLPLVGIDEVVLDTLERYVVEGSIDREKFKNGEIIFAEGDRYRLGESISMVSPVLPEGSSASKLNGELKVVTREAPVAARIILPEEEKEKVAMKMLPGCVFYSVEKLMEENPNVRYDYLSASVKEGADEQAARDVMLRSLSRSKGCTLMDLGAMREDFRNSQRQWALLLFSLLTLLLVVSCVCIYMITSSKVRNSLHSYTLLRAVGSSKKDTLRLLLYDAVMGTLKWFLIGGALGFLFDYREQSINFYTKAWDIYLSSVLPVYLGTLVVVLLIQALCCRVIVHRMMRQSVVEAIRDITY